MNYMEKDISRLAVLLPYYLPRDAGPMNAFFDKVNEWSKATSVRVFVLSKNREDSLEEFDSRFELVYGRTRRESLASFRKIIESEDFDLLYMRYNVPLPAYRRIMRKIPTVVEIHSVDLLAYRFVWKKLLIPCLLFRWGYLRRAAGYVYLNQGIANHWSYRYFRSPSFVVSNGIDLTGYERLASSRPPSGPPLKVAMTVGDSNPWQGVDKFVELAEWFPEHEFHLVGPQLSRSIPTNLKCHGRLSRKQLDLVLQQSHVGIGTLALHRSNREEASSLKTREYLANNLAVILAYRDTDSEINTLGQTLTLPNTEDNISTSLELLREFFRRVSAGDLQYDPVDFLSTTSKEEHRVRFLSSIARSWD